MATDESKSKTKNDETATKTQSPRSDGRRNTEKAKMKKYKTIWITKETKPFLTDFDVRGQIGSAGQFGLVYRCRRKSDRQKFAVKTINKSRFYRLGQNSQERYQLLSFMQGEIDILQVIKGRHENIINFESVYEDKHFLYIVMEECRGGELMHRIQERIKKQKPYSEPDAANIIKSVCSAIYYMHNYHRIVHCDLKPENILFLTTKADSPIKIVDFGMSQVLPKLRELTRFVGTPYYTAPEILEGKYAHGADMWSIGVIMFLMIFGFPPFYVDKHKYYGYQEQKAIYSLIKKGFTAEVKRGFGPWFPKRFPVSDEARDLITKLLTYDRDQRITARDMLEHPWIKYLGRPKAQAEANDEDVTIDGMQKDEPVLTQAQSDEFQKFEDNHKHKMAFAQLFRELFNEMRPIHFQLLRKKFESIDKNNTKSIKFSKLKEAMTDFITNNKELKGISHEKLENLFSGDLSSIDENEDIYYDDLLDVATSDYIIDRDENLYSTLRELDSDDTGMIDTKQLKDKIGQSKTYGKVNDIEKIIDESKLDENGKINYEEFLKTLHPSYDDKPKWFRLGLESENDEKDKKNNNNDNKKDNKNDNKNNDDNNNNKSNNTPNKPNDKHKNMIDDDSKQNESNINNNNKDKTKGKNHDTN